MYSISLHFLDYSSYAARKKYNLLTTELEPLSYLIKSNWLSMLKSTNAVGR